MYWSKAANYFHFPQAEMRPGYQIALMEMEMERTGPGILGILHLRSNGSPSPPLSWSTFLALYYIGKVFSTKD